MDWKSAGAGMIGTLAIAAAALGGFHYFHSRHDTEQADVPREPAPGSPDDSDARMIAALKMQAAATDWELTGDRNGHAEWRPPTDGFYTICGVTPEGRYLIAKNEIGQSRYDEPLSHKKDGFLAAWSRAQCDKTSPMRQVGILRGVQRARAAEAEDRMYNLNHRINSECLIAELRAEAGQGDYHLDRNRHYCQDGSFEHDRAPSPEAEPSP